jgi:hypothetical protein
MRVVFDVLNYEEGTMSSCTGLRMALKISPGWQTVLPGYVHQSVMNPGHEPGALLDRRRITNFKNFSEAGGIRWKF